jgi:Ala-tRNA(Pro) deacylase
MDSLHPAFGKICALLDAQNIKYNYFTHQEVRTSEEAAALRPEFTLRQGAKALIIRVSPVGLSQPSEENTGLETQDSLSPTPDTPHFKTFFALCVLPADYKLDNSGVKKMLSIKDFRFATPEEVEKITNGVKLGGIPPFGSIFGIQTYVDPELLNIERIIFNAGDRRVSLTLKSADWKTVENPIVAQVAKRPQ